MREIAVRCLAEGNAEGAVTVLRTPLSFWGGFDVATGCVIDRSHPSFGEVLTGKILVMPSGRGSSSASSVLAEAIRIGTAPAGIILAEPDSIIPVGAIVAQKLYGKTCPVVVCSVADLKVVKGWKRLRIEVQEVEETGEVVVGEVAVVEVSPPSEGGVAAPKAQTGWLFNLE